MYINMYVYVYMSICLYAYISLCVYVIKIHGTYKHISNFLSFTKISDDFFEQLWDNWLKSDHNSYTASLLSTLLKNDKWCIHRSKVSSQIFCYDSCMKDVLSTWAMCCTFKVLLKASEFPFTCFGRGFIKKKETSLKGLCRREDL